MWLSYRGDLDGLGQLGNGCGSGGRDAGTRGAVLLVGRVLHGSSQELGLGLLDQHLLLRWTQGQLAGERGGELMVQLKALRVSPLGV